jgi:hypothetical protein
VIELLRRRARKANLLDAQNVSYYNRKEKERNYERTQSGLLPVICNSEIDEVARTSR